MWIWKCKVKSPNCFLCPIYGTKTRLFILLSYITRKGSKSSHLINNNQLINAAIPICVFNITVVPNEVMSHMLDNNMKTSNQRGENRSRQVLWSSVGWTEHKHRLTGKVRLEFLLDHLCCKCLHWCYCKLFWMNSMCLGRTTTAKGSRK